MVTTDAIEEDGEVLVIVEVDGDGDVKSEVIRDIVVEENMEVKGDTMNAVEDSVCCDSWMQVGCSSLHCA